MDQDVHDKLVAFIEVTKSFSKRQQKAMDSFGDRVASLKDSLVEIALLRSLLSEARTKSSTKSENLSQASKLAGKILRKLKPHWKLFDEPTHSELKDERAAIVNEQSFFVDEVTELQQLSGRFRNASDATIKKVKKRILEFQEATEELENEKDVVNQLQDLNKQHLERLKSQSLLLRQLVRVLEDINPRTIPKSKSDLPVEDILRTLSRKLLDSLEEEQKQEIIPMRSLMKRKQTVQQKVFALVSRRREASFTGRVAQSLKSFTNMFSRQGRITIADAKRDLQTMIMPSEKIDYVSSLLQHPELLNDKTIKFLGQMVTVFREKPKAGSLLAPLFSTFNIPVYGREPWEKMCNTEIRNAIRSNTPLSVIMLDIDHFKRINDAYGHPAGDIAIRDFGTICTKHTREDEPVGRYGGEEFIIVIRGDIRAANVVAERIRKSVEAHAFNYEGTSINFTCSAGIASLAQDISSESIDAANKVLRSGGSSKAVLTQLRTELITKADRRLYLAKDSGRNKVIALASLTA